MLALHGPQRIRLCWASPLQSCIPCTIKQPAPTSCTHTPLLRPCAGLPSLQAGLAAGTRQRTSQLCAAMLEANGVLPDPQGRRLGEADDDADAGADGAQLAAGAAGGVGAADHRLLGQRLASRRRLYDSMESALLHQGLALGERLAGVAAGWAG